MPSRSSSEPAGGKRLLVGRVAGHRGRGGELTVRTRGEAATWVGLSEVTIDGPGEGRRYEVENARAYRDRLVLKLAGVDDANGAAALRGGRVEVERGLAPELPEGLRYVADLVGLLVVDESGHEIGRVEGVLASGDADVLQVRAASGKEESAEELMIPLAPDFVREIDVAGGRVVARVPPELRELNRRSCG